MAAEKPYTVEARKFVGDVAWWGAVGAGAALAWTLLRRIIPTAILPILGQGALWGAVIGATIGLSTMILNKLSK